MGLMVYGRKVVDLNLARRGAWVLLEGFTQHVGCDFDHISWTSPDWDGPDPNPSKRGGVVRK